MFCLQWLTVSFILICLALSQEINLPLNPNATLVSEIHSITHNAEHRQVVVRLSKSRKCDQPTFVVRMSGTALYLLKLKLHLKYLQIFTYPAVLDTGTYFLEVVILFCRAFNPDDFARRCMQDPSYGKSTLTVPYPIYLEASKGADLHPWTLSKARWTHANPSAVVPLRTRYQLRVEESPGHLACNKTWLQTFCMPTPREVKQHERYTWTDGPLYTQHMQTVLAHSTAAIATVQPLPTAALPLLTTSTSSETTVINICIIGDSHARELAYSKRFLTEPLSRVEIVRITSFFPQLFNISQLSEFHCSVAVISYGQWPLSGNIPHPYKRSRYHKEMRIMMNKVSRDAYSGTTKIFFRSENYNGLGYYFTQCPPRDARSMPAIDAINDVVERLALELQHDYIDMSHIVGPQWDGGFDFYHPSFPVFTAQLTWMLHFVFATLGERKTAVTLYPQSIVRAQNQKIPEDNQAVADMRDNFAKYGVA